MDAQTMRDLVNRAVLTAPVRRLLNSQTAEVTDWAIRPLGYAAASVALNVTTRNLFRVAGHAQDQGQTRSWSTVLKMVSPPPGEQYAGGQLAPKRPPYDSFWACDLLAYQSGLLADLSGIAAPRFYGVVEVSDGPVLLWLEEIVEDVPHAWPLERYGLAARHFGRFAGAYLTGRPMPTAWWLGRGRFGPRETLPTYAFRDRAAVVEKAETWDHPLVREVYPVPIVERLRRWWAEYDAFYGALQRLPRTLCHFDAFRINLLARHDPVGNDQTVAVDWEHLGVGGIGQELAAMVAATVGWFEVPGEHVRDLAETVFAGYVDGLRDVGWAGDPVLARLGFAISAAAYSFAYSALHLIVDEEIWGRYRPIWGRPLDEIAHQWSSITYFHLDMADEARRLMQ